MYHCQQNVYTDTTVTETYLGVQPKSKQFNFTKFFSGIGHLMASTKVACFTQHYRTFNNTVTDYIKRNCSNFHSFQSGFGRNPPHFQPVTSVVQVVYRAHDAISYP